MGRMRRLLLPFILFLAGLGSGCAVNQTAISGFNLISVEDEKQLGAKFALEIEKQYTVVNDPELQGYVDRLGKRLLAGAREVEFDYTFKAVKDDSVNAFAIPGGHIYVNTGLIKTAQNETELAGVMAHEINHAVARHGTRQLTQQYGYALLLQLVLGDNPSLVAQLAASMFGKAGFMAYSRGMETQADYLGVETMYRTGYNPEGMLTFFEKLDSMHKESPGGLTQFFSSHPLTGERIQRVKEEIAKLPPRSYQFSGDNSEFRKIQGRLR
ncbi:MAG: peptidase M48 [Geobacteraceae bacterium]|nr:MAG: peptidase M48 [Geobacteraceae bacterium]